MLRGQGIRIRRCLPHQDTPQWNFLFFFFACKINVSLRWLILCLYTNQVKVLLSKQRICLQKREQLAPVTSIRGLFVLRQ